MYYCYFFLFIPTDCFNIKLHVSLIHVSFIPVKQDSDGNKPAKGQVCKPSTLQLSFQMP